jgi:hypothetical protein
MSKETEKFFHGEFYTEEAWGSTIHVCCKLCKTKCHTGRHKHWAKGLCRSCYRRLSVTHRLYNDKWNKGSKEGSSAHKKAYKTSNPKDLVFDELDITTLLDRYDWKCAYSRVPLQGYDHRLGNAFQLEYLVTKGGDITLVPVARSINCSKKGLNTQEQLCGWAIERGIDYPFNIITVNGFLEE